MVWSADLQGPAWRPEADVCLLFGPPVDTRNNPLRRAACCLLDVTDGVKFVPLLGRSAAFLVAELEHVRHRCLRCRQKRYQADEQAK